jgi:non-lysosomal glucosylceramidase
VPYDAATGAYVDTRVARGFPLGGIGAGGLCLQTDGSFGELRANNNWMCPVRGLRGALHALRARAGDVQRAVLLRRAGPEPEYAGLPNVRGTAFVGLLPGFTLRYDDATLPVDVALHGFTPHVPHDVRRSTLPVAVFRFVVTNRQPVAAEVALLFAFENVLGRGGSGHLGLVLGPDDAMAGVRPRVVYDSVAGSFQEAVVVDGHRGVRFRTDQAWPAGDHRRSVTGEYLLLAERAPGLDVTVCAGWDADDAAPAVLAHFAREGRVGPGDGARRGVDGGYRPAAAVAVATRLAPGETRDVVFTLAWWTADHVTERALAAERPPGPRDGVRVGHVYEAAFAGPDAVAAHVLARRARLEAESTEVARLVLASSLPAWLTRATVNAIDAVLANTVVPRTGVLYTLEGVDWHWPMGALTGTNDQRLAAHPYMATFFPELDLSELREFARLQDARGAVPHGNGNADLALGTTDVPYGWPMHVKDFLPAKEWTDLTMSLVLQVARHWRTSGRRDVLAHFWPVLVRGMDYLDGIAPRGVPEGGTTYDVWDFPGTFAYTATLYLATLAAMRDMAAHVEPARDGVLAARAARAAERLETLWDARGYYRSSETQDTLFTAALAGDWAARWVGLAPVVDPARARRHLRHAQRVLVDAAVHAAGDRWRPLPRAEAALDGTPVRIPMGAGLPPDEEMTYVWQVLAYQAMEAIYVGLVDDGLRTMRLVYDRIWHDGNAWSAGLRGNGESIYMTHPVAWAALHALAGTALDVPGATLHLGPRLAPLQCPVFFASCWAWLDAGATQAELRVLRTFGAPVTIRRLVTHPGDGPPRVRDVEPVVLEPGRRLAVALC